MKKIIFILLLFFSTSCFIFAGPPYWWDNPHKDDEYDMYEKGSAAKCATEQEAVQKAFLSAKMMLMERVGIQSALSAAGLKPSPEYAIVDCTEADTATEKKGSSWSAWVLVKYPQKEKQKLLDRWNASITSLNELKETENRIPVQFGLALGTTSGYTEYRNGECVGLTVTSDRDAYLVVLDHQSDGTTVLLFPNRYHPDCLVRADEKTMIPDPSAAAFRLVVSPPFGDDRLEAVASTQLTSLQDKMKGLLDNLSGADTVAAASRGLFIKSLEKAVDSAGSGIAWSRAELTISTYQK